MINGKTFLNQPVQNYMETKHLENCESSRRWLYNWFSSRLSLFQKILMIAIDSSKQQALDTDPKAIKQIILMEI